MARDPQDREDLLRDATGLAERVELELPDLPTSVICGFRAEGALSIYWGQEEAVQFNGLGELRRGFWQGRLLASYERQLHWLDRGGEGSRIRLVRRPFTEQQRDTFLSQLAQRLDQLGRALAAGEYRPAAQVPADLDVVDHLNAWFACYWFSHPQAPLLARHPGLGRRPRGLNE